MEEMAEDSEENYNKHFSQFIAADLAGEDLEDKLKEVWDLLDTLLTLSMHLSCFCLSNTQAAVCVFLWAVCIIPCLCMVS